MVTNKSFTLEKALEVVKSREAHPHIDNAVKILEQCCDRYTAQEIFLSFNGGKDCTTVLHLAASIFKIRKLSSLVCLYVTEDPFPEVSSFVAEAANYYGLDLVIKKKPIRAALIELQNEKPTMEASLLGTRRGDPGTDELQAFSLTDPGWPKLMRVCPILDWSYSQVWQFLRDHKVPYCSLYDQGYTSLGSRSTTLPNPLLRCPGGSYSPAYTLRDDSTERHGRS